MKSFSLFILALFYLAILPGCQQDEVAPFRADNNQRLEPVVGGYAPNPGSPTVQPEVFEPLFFSNAKGWNIEWEIPATQFISFPHEDHDFWDDCAGFLSTVDGSLHSFNELNNLGWEATSNADMYLPIGKLQSPSRFPLAHVDHRQITFFKPSDLTPEEMMAIAENRPAYFELAYELNPAQPRGSVPYDPDDHTAFYQEDEVYIFKTGRRAAKYGAVRIKNGPSHQASSFYHVEVEVVVQSNGLILF